ncbi:MAG: hypothetical protein AAFY91_01925 [Bacteroidota bacterium]
MNKLFLALSLFALTFATVDAQRGQRSERRADMQARVEQRLQQLSEELDLTNDQIAHLKDFAETEGAALRERVRNTDDREVKRDLASAYMQAFQAEVEATLTPEQQDELDGMREDRQEEAQERRQAMRARAQEQLVELVEELDLTADQRSQLNAFVESQQAAKQEELAAATTRQEQADIHRSYAEAFKAELDTVLTEEQQAQLEEIRQEARTNRRPSSVWDRRERRRQ